MPAGAELLLSELVLDKDEPRGPGGSSNLNMLLYFAGRETTRTEYELMLAEAGFVDCRRRVKTDPPLPVEF